MSTYKISEEGKNGQVTLGETGIDRVIKRIVGKDDRQFIPYKSISFVEHDRKRLGRDQVAVHVGHKKFEWKVQLDAEGFVNALNIAVAGGGHRPTAAPAPAPVAAASSAPPPPPPVIAPAPVVPANWYPDPHARHELRYHDGTAWTAHVSNAGVTANDPL